MVLFLLLWVGLSINVPYPEFYLLQHLPTTIAWIVIFIMLHYRLLRETDFYALVLFLILHLIGARYLYSLVPYDDWLDWFFGFTLTETFHWHRNHYDRFVHFMYGILLAIPLWHLCERFVTKSQTLLVLFTIQAILATSTLYELAEWALAMVAAPDMAESYNGQQGDMWDAQKDVALALLGCLITCSGLLWVVGKKQPGQTS
ncbi:MAG: DUF2238 domain-containing protein [Planctomycetaceae bacterium]|nr:DUF2238 domain-containing protein [Planctomycetaceae bacterium]